MLHMIFGLFPVLFSVVFWCCVFQIVYMYVRSVEPTETRTTNISPRRSTIRDSSIPATSKTNVSLDVNEQDDVGSSFIREKLKLREMECQLLKEEKTALVVAHKQEIAESHKANTDLEDQLLVARDEVAEFKRVNVALSERLEEMRIQLEHKVPVIAHGSLDATKLSFSNTDSTRLSVVFTDNITHVDLAVLKLSSDTRSLVSLIVFGSTTDLNTITTFGMSSEYDTFVFVVCSPRLPASLVNLLGDVSKVKVGLCTKHVWREFANQFDCTLSCAQDVSSVLGLPAYDKDNSKLIAVTTIRSFTGGDPTMMPTNVHPECATSASTVSKDNVTTKHVNFIAFTAWAVRKLFGRKALNLQAEALRRSELQKHPTHSFSNSSDSSLVLELFDQSQINANTLEHLSRSSGYRNTGIINNGRQKNGPLTSTLKSPLARKNKITPWLP
eukprot:m.14771 g.14771  ORF g.14771 m.14771 type:complete len:442 (-) comp10281_c0_seq1:188-1513(-)